MRFTALIPPACERPCRAAPGGDSRRHVWRATATEMYRSCQVKRRRAETACSCDSRCKCSPTAADGESKPDFYSGNTTEALNQSGALWMVAPALMPGPGMDHATFLISEPIHLLHIHILSHSRRLSAAIFNPGLSKLNSSI
ncbi:hypothetical protein EYF80_058498 [Liparis tanakae]|uniref:Uncharacterized protein n=1 Tax=Liparis tanakae TaxID=230148 RepID=A0A4Z2ERW9_9TELE|nr:hypothetical protein EYF80_058498 [Liparis tanakae]